MDFQRRVAVKSIDRLADDAGLRTLRRMISVDRYNKWLYRELRPHVGRRVLEVGCGIGTMTPLFLDAERITSIDPLPESVLFVRQQFAACSAFEALVDDITDPTIARRLAPQSYDTIACINVLEHIERDREALRNMYDILSPGGKLLLFVPAGSALYGHLDVALGHHRRYSLPELREAVCDQGFGVIQIFHMNAAGIPGWFVCSRILRRSAPPRGMLWLFNALVPAFIWLEGNLRPPFGQSLLCIAQRPG